MAPREGSIVVVDVSGDDSNAGETPLIMGDGTNGVGEVVMSSRRPVIRWVDEGEEDTTGKKEDIIEGEVEDSDYADYVDPRQRWPARVEHVGGRWAEEGPPPSLQLILSLCAGDAHKANRVMEWFAFHATDQQRALLRSDTVRLTANPEPDDEFIVRHAGFPIWEGSTWPYATNSG